MTSDRYGDDILARDPHARPRRVVPDVPGDLGLVVECADSGWCGALVGWDRAIEGWAVRLEDRHGRTRVFPALPAAFLLDGHPVTLVRPTRPASGVRRTASGSIAVEGQRARVARASRILVEGRHDAELVEKVWGDDLRVEGVVVEMLDGVDHVPAMVAGLDPAADRRLGILVDHLVAGSKESRIAAEVMARYPDDVLVVGHPFVDIWEAITPAAAGIDAWPSIPRGQDWKSGVCAALDWGDDTGHAWRRLLNRVTSWTDLDPRLLGPVEELIDFVTSEH